MLVQWRKLAIYSMQNQKRVFTVFSYRKFKKTQTPFSEMIIDSCLVRYIFVSNSVLTFSTQNKKKIIKRTSTEKKEQKKNKQGSPRCTHKVGFSNQSKILGRNVNVKFRQSLLDLVTNTLFSKANCQSYVIHNFFLLDIRKKPVFFA